MTKEKYLAYEKEFIESIKYCLEHANEGWHFCIPINHFYITGDPEEEDGEIVIVIYVTDKVDSLNYCYGEIYADGYPDENSSDIELKEYFRYFMDIINAVENK